jgi:uncharacterized OB-fold protein
VTLAVDAGRAALDAGGTTATSVVLVTRDLPLLDGGTEAVLLAGLGLPDTARCVLVLGGAPAALDAVSGAEPGTLVVAVDVAPAAAAAGVLVGDGASAADVSPLDRVARSLPVRVRTSSGAVHDYDDPRLLRSRGTGAAIARLALHDKPVALAGMGAKDAAALTQGTPAALPSEGAAAGLFALADALIRQAEGPVVAVDQATACAVQLRTGTTPVVSYAPAPQPSTAGPPAPGGDIKLSVAAYERAFDAKLGLQAGQCTSCGTLALPPRRRCTGCGSEEPHRLTPLPRHATVYTCASVHVPVPGMSSPYDLVIVELGDSGVRLLAPVTGTAAGTIRIGDTGRMVLRRHALRAGVPDYGYALLPDASPTTGSTP